MTANARAGASLADELRFVAEETACAAVRAREAIHELQRAASDMADEVPANGDSIRQVAKAYGIPVRHRQLKHIVLNLADLLLEEVSSAKPQVSKTVLAFAPEKDLRDWKAREVLPASAYHEAALSAWMAREQAAGADDAAAAAEQLERCKLALAYPAELVAHIARAALAGDTSPMLGAYERQRLSNGADYD